jgi:hypothetical protein
MCTEHHSIPIRRFTIRLRDITPREWRFLLASASRWARFGAAAGDGVVDGVETIMSISTATTISIATRTLMEAIATTLVAVTVTTSAAVTETT